MNIKVFATFFMGENWKKESLKANYLCFKSNLNKLNYSILFKYFHDNISRFSLS